MLARRYRRSRVIPPSRVAAILVEIDANDLNNVFVCRHFIILKIGNYIGTLFRCSVSQIEISLGLPSDDKQPVSQTACLNVS